jgi:hypothetical protein
LMRNSINETGTVIMFNIFPVWPDPKYPKSDIFAVNYKITDVSDSGPLLIWHELNGDPMAPPFNTILDGTLFAKLDSETIDRVNNKTAWIVINTANECIGPSYTDEEVRVDYLNLHEILTVSAMKYGIDPTSVIWLTGDLNAEDKLIDLTPIHVISACVFVPLVHRMITAHQTAVSLSTFSHPYKFKNVAISPNRHINSHRTYMITRLAQLELLENINYSFPRNIHGKTISDGYCDLKIKSNISPTFDQHNLIDWDQMAVTCMELYQCELPLTIDVDPNTNTCLGLDAFLTLKQPYQDSIYSILTESHADGGKCFISEALVVAIVMQTPFLLVGNRGVLAQMRAWGLHTFDDLFDESYDDEVDDIKRYEMIIEQIQRIDNMPWDELLAIRMSMKQKLDENVTRLATLSAELDQSLNDKLSRIIANSN